MIFDEEPDVDYKCKICWVNNWYLDSSFHVMLMSNSWNFAMSWTSNMDMEKLKKVKHATKWVMWLHADYEERLQMLGIRTLHKFLLAISERHFDKIAGDVTHPLQICITFNYCSVGHLLLPIPHTSL